MDGDASVWTRKDAHSHALLRRGAPERRFRSVATGASCSKVSCHGHVVSGGMEASELERRLLEMGFIEGARVEVLHEGFIGRDPDPR